APVRLLQFRVRCVAFNAEYLVVVPFAHWLFVKGETGDVRRHLTDPAHPSSIPLQSLSSMTAAADSRLPSSHVQRLASDELLFLVLHFLELRIDDILVALVRVAL